VKVISAKHLDTDPSAISHKNMRGGGEGGGEKGSGYGGDGGNEARESAQCEMYHAKIYLHTHQCDVTQPVVVDVHGKSVYVCEQ